MRGSVRRRKVRGVAHPHAPAIHAPASGANQECAALPEEPRAKLAALQRIARAKEEIALRMIQQVAEQTDRHPLRPRAGRGQGRDLVGAASRLQPRDQPRVGEADRR